MRQSTTTAAIIRPYRLYFRSSDDVLWRSHEVDVASEEEARELGALMLDEQAAYACAEVWDRARYVCTVRRDD
jgi:hypothetical protein